MAAMAKSTTNDVGLLVLRLWCAGLMMAFHGVPRAIRVYDHLVLGAPWPFVDVVAGLGFPSPLVFALLSSAAEVIGPVMVGAGIFTRWAALMLASNMAVAVYAEASKGDSFELPALYFVMALTLMVTGGGSYRIGRLFGRR
jgi:putative oxidoreductase